MRRISSVLAVVMCSFVLGCGEDDGAKLGTPETTTNAENTSNSANATNAANAANAANSANAANASNSGMDMGVEPDAAVPDLGETDMGADASMAEVVFETAFEDFQVSYMTDYPAGSNVTRGFPVRVRFPVDFEGAAPVVVVSHGGSGNPNGHTTFAHIGEELASHGYVAVHIAHVESSNIVAHWWDRPNDVTTVLDRLEAGDLTPTDYAGSVDVDRVGHLGHSWGAYTAHAVAGADFKNPVSPGQNIFNFRDARIDAIVALSPQGWEQFGAFDDERDLMQPSTNNSWRVVQIPAYTLIGELELDGVVGIEDGNQGAFRAENWRLFPFVRYPEDETRYATVLPDATHADLGGGATADVNAYVAKNARAFFEVHVVGDDSREDEIGLIDLYEGVQNRRK